MSLEIEMQLQKGYDRCNVIFITNGLFTDLHKKIYLSNIDFNKISFSQFQNVHQNTKVP